MTDVVSPEVRSRMMAGIRGKDTKPEMMIRRALHSLGYRYRLHNGALPGRPDLTLPKHRAVVFVNGCFWHRHGCHLFKWPRTRPEFWREKIGRNADKDLESRNLLIGQRWRVLTVWECALKGEKKLPFESMVTTIVEWIDSDVESLEIVGNGTTDQQR